MKLHHGDRAAERRQREAGRASRSPAGRPTASPDSGIGIVFQHSRPLHRQTVLEHIKLALLPDSLLMLVADHARRRRRAREIAERVGLGEVMHRLPRTLPFADLRRLELAKAMARDPKVVLVDEPFAGLTAGRGRHFLRTDRQLPRARATPSCWWITTSRASPRWWTACWRCTWANASPRAPPRRSCATRRCARVYLGGKIETHPRRSAMPARASRCWTCADVGVLYGKAQALDDVSIHVGRRRVRFGRRAERRRQDDAVQRDLRPGAVSAATVDWSGAALRGRTPASIARGGIVQCPETPRTVRRHERAGEPRSGRPASGSGAARGEAARLAVRPVSDPAIAPDARRPARCRAASSRCWRSRGR